MPFLPSHLSPMRLTGILISLLILPCVAEAQTFTQHLQQKRTGYGSVIVYQDSTLRLLLDGRRPDRPVMKPQPQPQPSHGHGATAKTSAKVPARPHHNAPHESQKSKPEPATGEKIDRVDTSFSNKTYRQRRRQAGYRIQIYSGDNSRQARQKAYQLGYLFKSYFPDIPVYTHFYSPHWVCRAGDFRTIGEARSVLGKMRYIKGLSGAAIIRSTIQVEIYE